MKIFTAVVVYMVMHVVHGVVDIIDKCLNEDVTKDQVREYFAGTSTTVSESLNEYFCCAANETGVITNEGINTEPLEKICYVKQNPAEALEKLYKCKIITGKDKNERISKLFSCVRNVMRMEDAGTSVALNELLMYVRGETIRACLDDDHIRQFYHGNSTTVDKNLQKYFHCVAQIMGLITKSGIAVQSLKIIANTKKDPAAANAEIDKCKNVTGSDHYAQAGYLAVCLRKVIQMETAANATNTKRTTAIIKYFGGNTFGMCLSDDHVKKFYLENSTKADKSLQKYFHCAAVRIGVMTDSCINVNPLKIIVNGKKDPAVANVKLNQCGNVTGSNKREQSVNLAKCIHNVAQLKNAPKPTNAFVTNTILKYGGGQTINTCLDDDYIKKFYLDQSATIDKKLQKYFHCVAVDMGIFINSKTHIRQLRIIANGKIDQVAANEEIDIYEDVIGSDPYVQASNLAICVRKLMQMKTARSRYTQDVNEIVQNFGGKTVRKCLCDDHVKKFYLENSTAVDKNLGKYFHCAAVLMGVMTDAGLDVEPLTIIANRKKYPAAAKAAILKCNGVEGSDKIEQATKLALCMLDVTKLDNVPNPTSEAFEGQAVIKKCLNCNVTENQVTAFFHGNSRRVDTNVKEYLHCAVIETGIMTASGFTIEPLRNIANRKCNPAEANAKLCKCKAVTGKDEMEVATNFSLCVRSVIKLVNTDKKTGATVANRLLRYGEGQPIKACLHDDYVQSFYHGYPKTIGEDLKRYLKCVFVKIGVLTDEGIDIKPLQMIANGKKDPDAANAQLEKCTNITGSDANELASNLALCVYNMTKLENASKPTNYGVCDRGVIIKSCLNKNVTENDVQQFFNNRSVIPDKNLQIYFYCALRETNIMSVSGIDVSPLEYITIGKLHRGTAIEKLNRCTTLTGEDKHALAGKIAVYVRDVMIMETLPMTLTAYRTLKFGGGGIVRTCLRDDYVKKFYTYSPSTVDERLKKYFYCAAVEIGAISNCGVDIESLKTIAQRKKQSSLARTRIDRCKYIEGNCKIEQSVNLARCMRPVTLMENVPKPTDAAFVDGGVIIKCLNKMVTKDHVRRFFECKTVNVNRSFRQYLCCALEETGIMTAAGINIDPLKNLTKGKQNQMGANTILNKCKTVRGVDKYERATNFASCVRDIMQMENAPNKTVLYRIWMFGRAGTVRRCLDDDYVRKFYLENTTTVSEYLQKYFNCVAVRTGVITDSGINIEQLRLIAMEKKDPTAANVQLDRCKTVTGKDLALCVLNVTRLANSGIATNNAFKKGIIVKKCLNETATIDRVKKFFQSKRPIGYLKKYFHCALFEAGIMTPSGINIEQLRNITNEKKNPAAAIMELNRCKQGTGTTNEEQACNLTLCIRNVIQLEDAINETVRCEISAFGRGETLRQCLVDDHVQQFYLGNSSTVGQILQKYFHCVAVKIGVMRDRRINMEPMRIIARQKKDPAAANAILDECKNCTGKDTNEIAGNLAVCVRKMVKLENCPKPTSDAFQEDCVITKCLNKNVTGDQVKKFFIDNSTAVPENLQQYLCCATEETGIISAYGINIRPLKSIADGKKNPTAAHCELSKCAAVTGNKVEKSTKLGLCVRHVMQMENATNFEAGGIIKACLNGSVAENNVREFYQDNSTTVDKGVRRYFYCAFVKTGILTAFGINIAPLMHIVNAKRNPAAAYSNLQKCTSVSGMDVEKLVLCVRKLVMLECAASATIAPNLTTEKRTTKPSNPAQATTTTKSPNPTQATRTTKSPNPTQTTRTTKSPNPTDVATAEDGTVATKSTTLRADATVATRAATSQADATIATTATTTTTEATIK